MLKHLDTRKNSIPIELNKIRIASYSEITVQMLLCRCNIKVHSHVGIVATYIIIIAICYYTLYAFDTMYLCFWQHMLFD